MNEYKFFFTSYYKGKISAKIIEADCLESAYNEAQFFAKENNYSISMFWLIW